MTFPLLVSILYQGDSWELAHCKLGSGDNCPVALFELERFIDANVIDSEVPSRRPGHQMQKQQPTSARPVSQWDVFAPEF